MSFLKQLFNKKEVEPVVNEQIIAPLPDIPPTSSSVSLPQEAAPNPIPSSRPVSNEASQLQAEDEEASLLESTSNAPVSASSSLNTSFSHSSVDPVSQSEQITTSSAPPSPVQKLFHSFMPKDSSSLKQEIPSSPTKHNVVMSNSNILPEKKPEKKEFQKIQSQAPPTPPSEPIRRPDVVDVRQEVKNIKNSVSSRQEEIPDVVAYPGAPGSGKIFEGIYVRKERYVELLTMLKENREGLHVQLSNEERLLQVQESIVHNLEKEETLLSELFKQVMTIDVLHKRC